MSRSSDLADENAAGQGLMNFTSWRTAVMAEDGEAIVGPDGHAAHDCIVRNEKRSAVTAIIRPNIDAITLPRGNAARTRRLQNATPTT